MSSLKSQLNEIEQFIIHSEYQKALKVIENGLKTKGLEKENKLQFLLQKSLALFMLGNTQESLKLAQQVQKESKGLDNKLLQVDALVRVLINSEWVDRYNEGLDVAEEGLEILIAITDHPPEELALRKAQLINWKASIITQLGDFEAGAKLGDEAIKIAELSGYKHAISFVYIRTAGTYLFLGDHKRAEEYINKGIEVATEIGNKFFIALGCVALANFKRIKKEYQEAIELFEKAFSLAKEIGTTLMRPYNDLAILHAAMFQLDKAIEYFQEALKIAEGGQYTIYGNLGIIYTWKYEFEKAQEYYLKSIELSKEVNDKRILPGVLSNLIWISTELNDVSKAQYYLDQLKEISEETGYPHITRRYRYASIWVLKTKGTINDLGQAVTLLEEFLAEKDLPNWYRLEALYIFLEIRIKELQLIMNEETLKEVQKRIHHLEFEAEEQQLLWFLANIYRLQSQLALIELNPKKAFEYLDKAQKIADEIKVEILKVNIKEDRDKIEQQLNMLNKLQEQQAPLNETIKLVSLENTIKNITKETVIEERNKETGQIIEYRKLFALKI
ncbi:MAG: tetratricopeptide repeat protein [Candidatus Heimdallarchaeota archaeon]|nr:tetratricopeptide repeat protein [Candidatus Heimdallarchaeota archaeon]